MADFGVTVGRRIAFGAFGVTVGRFVGWGPVLSVRDPTDTNFSELNNRKKVWKILFFIPVSKNVFLSKTERFSFFFGPWCTL